MTRSILTCTLVLAAAMAASLEAHHSPVMFDRSARKTLVGTVVEFVWTNPHASFALDVPNEKGSTDRWGVELGSPNSLARNGWRSSILKPGDKVTVVVNPLKSGEFGGIFVSITLADGRTLGGRPTD
jgi:Family of unknown function (DUF6152)